MRRFVVNDTKDIEYKPVGNGNFGCIYKPPIPCIDPKDDPSLYDNLVMKYMTDESAKEELKIADLLHPIDPNYNYFIYLTGKKCKVVSKKEDLKKNGCKIIKLKENYQGYMIPYGGIPFEDFSQNYPDLVSIPNYWNIFKQLFKAIQILHNEKIIHMDIKDDNILVKSDLHARLIDFGISFSYKGLNEEELYRHIWESMNAQKWAPMIVYILSEYSRENIENMTKDNIIDFLEDKIKTTYSKQYEFFSTEYNWKSNKLDFFKAYATLFTLDPKMYVKNIIIPNLGKIDIYMLAKSMKLELLYDIPKNKMGSEQFKTFIYLLDQMHHIDINMQFNFADVTAYIKKYNYLYKIK